MDLMLFLDDPRAVQGPTRQAFTPIAVPPRVTAETFAAWPEHMRREFALLTAERAAELSDDGVSRITGITADALGRARASKGLFAHSYSEIKVIDEDSERKRVAKQREYHRRRKSRA